MNEHVLRYSIIRFLPYVEMEEFANVGVVMIAPEIRFFDFRLETKRIARLIRIFTRTDQTAARKILQALDLELSRIKTKVASPDSSINQLFGSLVKAREGAIRYSEVRFAIDQDPVKKLESLYHFYVERKFAEQNRKDAGLEPHRAIP